MTPPHPDPGPDAPEADWLEQHGSEPVDPVDDLENSAQSAAAQPDEPGVEANPADWQEQQRLVEAPDEEEYPSGPADD